MNQPATIAEGLAIAERLTDADARLRVLCRGGLSPAPAELNAACVAVLKLSRDWQRYFVRLQIASN